MLDDEKIIALFYERSEQAIAELSEKYSAALVSIARNIFKNEYDAQECVNDAFLAAWNTIPPQNPNPLSTYVCRIVRNISIAKYHSNTALKRNSFYDVALDELESCLPSVSTAERQVTAHELSLLIDNFLNALDKESRIMFVRRYWYADSLSDISLMFKISANAAAVRLSRIRKKLKKILKKEGYWI